MMELTAGKVVKLITDEKFIIALGGEHSITAGVVRADQQALNEPFTAVKLVYKLAGYHHNSN